MARILIKETTSMERIEIVKDALDGEYDDFYDDYVSGKKELAELNREFSEKHDYSTALRSCTGYTT